MSSAEELLAQLVAKRVSLGFTARHVGRLMEKSSSVVSRIEINGAHLVKLNTIVRYAWAVDMAFLVGGNPGIENITSILTKARADLGWSLRHTGEQGGLFHTLISDVERGVSIPRLRTVAKLASGLGLPLTLVDRSEDEDFASFGG